MPTSTRTPQQRGPEPAVPIVEGQALLANIEATLRRYLIFPNASASVAIGLWVLAANALDAFVTFPMLAITSPTKRCGKTRLLELLAMLVPRAMTASNFTPATIYRSIEGLRPTILMDEADTFAKKHTELRGVINSGHTRRTAYVVRMVKSDGEWHPYKFPTWCPKVIAQIGRLIPTWEDRSVVIPMQRKRPDEAVTRLRRQAEEARMHARRRRAKAWAAAHMGTIEACYRTGFRSATKGLDDRAADNWEPLLAIAHVAGGTWPARAIEAARVLSAGRDAEDDDVPIRLLRGAYTVACARPGEDRIASAELVQALLADKEADWATAFEGRPLTQYQLARALRAFGIYPKTVAEAGTSRRCYVWSTFRDTWARYLNLKGAKGKKPVG